MGWSVPLGVLVQDSDFNYDFDVSLTEEQQREGAVEYNFARRGRRGRPLERPQRRRPRSRRGDAGPTRATYLARGARA